MKINIELSNDQFNFLFAHFNLLPTTSLPYTLPSLPPPELNYYTHLQIESLKQYLAHGDFTALHSTLTLINVALFNHLRPTITGN